MSGTEAAIQKRIIRQLKAHGWLVWNIKGTPWSPTGRPDLLAFREGRTLAIEVKQPGGRLSPKQVHEVAKLRAAKILVVVAESWEDVETVAALKTA